MPRLRPRRATPTRWPTLALLASVAAALLLVVGGCGRSALPEATWVSLDEMAARYRLQPALATHADRVSYAGEGLRVTFLAGRPYGYLDGRRFDLSEPVRRIGEGLWISESAIQTLPEAILRRAHAPAPVAPVAAAPLVAGTVILDPGHGGRDPGAQAHGVDESDITLDVAKRTAAQLRALGVKVYLTRSTDVFLDLDRRADLANRYPGALFVSIHANAESGSGGCVEGVETFHLRSSHPEGERIRDAVASYRLAAAGPEGPRALTGTEARAAAARMSQWGRAASPALAARIQGRLVAALGASDRGVKEAGFRVLRKSYFGPAVLTEIGFLTHAATAKRFATPSCRQLVATAIAQGVVDYLQAQVCAARQAQR